MLQCNKKFLKKIYQPLELYSVQVSEMVFCPFYFSSPFHFLAGDLRLSKKILLSQEEADFRELEIFGIFAWAFALVNLLCQKSKFHFHISVESLPYFHTTKVILNRGLCIQGLKIKLEAIRSNQITINEKFRI